MRLAPDVFGLADRTTATTVLAPLGGLNGDDVWGSIVYTAPAAEPLEQYKIAAVSVPERVRERRPKTAELDVPVRTMTSWAERYEEFSRALMRAKELEQS